jgi:hypothetical protein
MPKFHKLQRGVCLALFIISSAASYLNPHMIYISGLSILGVISFDLICFLKEKTSPVDHAPEIERLRNENILVLQKLQDIRNDASIGKLAETFRRG